MKPTRNTNIILWPFIQVADAARANVHLWKVTFWRAWEPLPFDTKLAWIAFISQTVAVITLIEIFLLRK